MIEKNYGKILEVIRIKLPNNIKYEHREFLSGIMKLGIKREKIGDIIIYIHPKTGKAHHAAMLVDIKNGKYYINWKGLFYELF